MMKSVFAVSILITATISSPLALAQMSHDHSTMQMPMQMQMQSGKPSTTAPAEGEVRSVDRTKGTIVLKHGPLTTLNMPPMTMEFVANDPKLLASVKPGDKVRFTPEQAKDGTLIVGTLEVVKN